MREIPPGTTGTAARPFLVLMMLDIPIKYNRMNCRSLAQDTSQITEKKVSRLPPSYWMHIPRSSNILCITSGKNSPLFAPLSVASVRSLSAPTAHRNFVGVGHTSSYYSRAVFGI